jgi:rhodanese-related sulfurtransferase
MTTIITREELLSKLQAGDTLTIVEALPPQYYNKEHLPGALNLPLDQVDELAPSLLPDKTAEIVVYCADSPCPNSGIAANRLVELGYTRVWDYDAGKADWIEAGLPTESARRRVESAA